MANVSEVGKKRYKDSLKTSLKGFSIDPANWESLTSARSTWCGSIHAGAVVFEDNGISKAGEKHAKQKAGTSSTNSSFYYIRINTAFIVLM